MPSPRRSVTAPADGARKPRHQVQERRLPCPVRAEKAGDARTEPERDVVDGDDVAVPAATCSTSRAGTAVGVGGTRGLRLGGRRGRIVVTPGSGGSDGSSARCFRRCRRPRPGCRSSRGDRARRRQGCPRTTRRSRHWCPARISGALRKMMNRARSEVARLSTSATMIGLTMKTAMIAAVAYARRGV